jgi:hypothetical protein
MKSLEFVKQRLIATRNAQVALTAKWQWPEKTVVQWDSDIAGLTQLENTESATRAVLIEHAGQWDAAVAQLYTHARDVARLGRTRFRLDAGKAALFNRVHVQSRGRSGLCKYAATVRDRWQQADPRWQPLPEMQLSAFSSTIVNVDAQETTHGQKLAAWREAAAKVMSRARTLNVDCMAWYAEATTRFPAGTPEGDMIRATVPTTTDAPSEPVGRAVIKNLVATDGTIHFDCDAAHATEFTYWHKAPDYPHFVLILADVSDKSLTLRGQPPGEHRFKVVPSNAQGTGPESPEAVVVLSVAQAA